MIKKRKEPMKIEKTVLPLFCAILLLATLSSCQLPGHQADTSVPSEAGYPADGDDASKPSATNPNILVTDTVYDDLEDTSIDKVTVYSLGEPALLSPTGDEDKTIRLTITGAEMSKTTCGYDLDYIPDLLGFDGTEITGDYSFVFVNIEVTNLSEEPQVVSTCLGYYYIGDDGLFRGQGGEAIFFDQAKDTQDYWFTLLEPGETLTAVVGFYVIGGLDLAQGFIPVNLSGATPNSGSEWFALTERE